MGNRGRFGKYGETKRLNRLRGSGIRDGHPRASAARGYPSSKKGLYGKARFTTRSARRSDKGFIAQLSGKVFTLYGPYRDMVSQWFTTGMTLTRIALADGAPAGFAMVGRWVQEESGDSVCELLAIAVEPDRQHQGIGGTLLQEIEKETEQLGEETLVLHTAVENLSAQNLFSKADYKPCGIKRQFYPAGQDALMMVKKIKK